MVGRMSDAKLIFGDPQSIEARDRARRWSAPGKMHANKPTDSYWRNRAREVIRNCIAQNPEKHGKPLRAQIQAVYPFGMRQYTPYKIWLQEIKLQMEYYGVNHE